LVQHELAQLARAASPVKADVARRLDQFLLRSPRS
jgi:hypothetical protein